jgi:hypothetical protein
MAHPPFVFCGIARYGSLSTCCISSLIIIIISPTPFVFTSPTCSEVTERAVLFVPLHGAEPVLRIALVGSDRWLGIFSPAFQAILAAFEVPMMPEEVEAVHTPALHAATIQQRQQQHAIPLT